MGVGPIIRIFAIAAIESTSDEREVKPSFALDRSSLMKDDDYGRSGREAERGLFSTLQQHHHMCRHNHILRSRVLALRMRFSCDFFAPIWNAAHPTCKRLFFLQRPLCSKLNRTGEWSFPRGFIPQDCHPADNSCQSQPRPPDYGLLR